MTDKNLKELQDIIRDAFLLQSRMHACMCHTVSGREGGVTLDVDMQQYHHLSNAYDHITEAISLIQDELVEEMRRRESK